MKTHGRLLRGSRLLLLPALALTVAPASFAQTAPNNATPAQLAKYDKNHNGRLDPDELAAMQADEAKAASAAENGTDKETVQLSPFEVKEANNGYYAANTMSGTRLNTKIDDLASSISVVTKAQMQDFALLDINDVFNYEASTEGTGNFTDFSIDRNGMVTDNIQNNPQGANRIRGIGPANMSLGNYATSGRVPVDPIAIDGIEISRGPNSNIFGLGQGSGTVNLIPSTAALNRETSVVELRVDSVGGYRSSLDLNRPLIPGKLALRGSYVYQHDAFNEKPSGATSHRYNLMLRAQPFKNTSVRASFQNYDFYGTRASTITPRDAVSYWKGIGQPTWNPIPTSVDASGVPTYTVSYADGHTLNVTGTTNPPGLGSPSFLDPVIFVDQGGVQLWEIQRMPQATATNGPNNTSGNNRLLETIAPPLRTGRPLYATVPGISDKSLFDYTLINLAGANSIKDHDELTTVELEQYFLNTERQQLALQLGWNHEHASRFNKNMVGQSSATGNSNYLYVDINKNLIDGRPNPYFLRPYLGVGEPVFSSQPYERDTFRGQLAYMLNTTNEKNWLKWLGRWQLLGYDEEKITKTHVYRFRDVNTIDNPIYAPAGQSKGNQSAPPPGFGLTAPLATRPYFHFYVGDNQGQNVDYAPTPFKQGAYTFNWFNPLANGGTGAWVADAANLGEAGIQEGSAGGAAAQNLLKTRGAVLQGTVWQDRIVFTGGKRHDESNTRAQRTAQLKSNGVDFDYAAMDGWVGDWALHQGDTTSTGFVARPFRGWRRIDELAGSSGASGFVGDLLRGLSVHYNRSDSFTPDSPAISVTMEQLPDPSSVGKDYGFALTLFDGKFVLRANRYTTNSINNRAGQFGTFGQRTLRVDIANFAGNNDAISLQRQARNWTRALNPSFSDQQVEDAVYKIMGLTQAQVATFNTSTIGETQDIKAHGDELEVNYNPSQYWTLKLNVTRTFSSDANIAPHIPGWIAQRMPIWTTVIDPRVGTPWFTTGYTNDTPSTTGGTPQAFLNANVISGVQLGQATEGKNRPDIREWHYNFTGSLRLARYTEQKFLKNVNVGGSLRWESKGSIGYYGIPINGDLSIATQYDPNRPIWAKANTYLDAFASYNTRLFHDKVRARFQLNVRNLQEWKTHLEPVAAYPDGTPNTFRIIEPFTVIFSTTFDL